MFKAIDGVLQSVKGDNGLLPRKSDLTSSDKIFRKFSLILTVCIVGAPTNML